LNEKHIQVHDFVFADGEAPPALIVDAWLQLIEARFNNQAQESDEEEKKPGEKLPCIATHCVAGLGRFVSMAVFGVQDPVYSCVIQLELLFWWPLR